MESEVMKSGASAERLIRVKRARQRVCVNRQRPTAQRVSFRTDREPRTANRF
jgi:hypothetical protein